MFVTVWTASGPIFALRNQFITFADITVKIMRWYHHCFSFDYRDSTYAMVLDGHMLAEGLHHNKLNNFRRECKLKGYCSYPNRSERQATYCILT